MCASKEAGDHKNPSTAQFSALSLTKDNLKRVGFPLKNRIVALTASYRSLRRLIFFVKNMKAGIEKASFVNHRS
jgi:hypothetical protein